MVTIPITINYGYILSIFYRYFISIVNCNITLFIHIYPLNIHIYLWINYNKLWIYFNYGYIYYQTNPSVLNLFHIFPIYFTLFYHMFPIFSHEIPTFCREKQPPEAPGSTRASPAARRRRRPRPRPAGRGRWSPRPTPGAMGPRWDIMEISWRYHGG